MKFQVDFITYKGLYRSIETDKLNIPAVDGRRTILSNHMPIIVPVDIGMIETSLDGKTYYWAVSDGLVHFENNKATVLCDEILGTDDIYYERVQKAIDNAQRKLEESTSEDRIIRARIALARATNLMMTKNKAKD